MLLLNQSLRPILSRGPLMGVSSLNIRLALNWPKMAIINLIELYLWKMDEIRNFGDFSSDGGVLHELNGIFTALHSSIYGSITEIMVEDQLPGHPKRALWHLNWKGLVPAVVRLCAVAAEEIYLCFLHYLK